MKAMHGVDRGSAVPSRLSRGNLPADLTQFIGRESEVAEVRRLLSSTRLLTLAGSAGVGKTRLALRVASQVADRYRDGVGLVELAPLADTILVPKTVAFALAVPEQPGRLLSASLVDALGPKQILVVLDNCEHLVQACAELVDILLRACPDLQILATSRQSLHVPGETTWRVPSMALPAADCSLAGDSLVRYDATRLFVERARAALPSFADTDRNAMAIVRICSRLDGIPLAIELAAARLAVLSADQIDDRLSDRFRLLTGGSRTALPRQQTLRATLDWSYGLLSDRERIVFRRLVVFAGGWSVAEAEAVCGDRPAEDKSATSPLLRIPIQPDDVFDLLAGLVDKSLVVVDETGGDRRYRLLETMREYGWEKLRAASEEAIVRQRQLDLMLALAEEVEGNIRGAGQAEWLTRLEREHDNIRAALAWCLARNDFGSALHLAGDLAWFWRLRGHIAEGRRWLDLALLTPEPTSTPVRSRALNGAGLLAYAQANYPTAKALFQESIELAREQQDLLTLAWALHGLGRVMHATGDLERANDALKESLAIFRGRHDIAGCAYSLYFLGREAMVRSDSARAAELYQEALLAAREVGDLWILGWIVAYMADLAFLQRDFKQAEALFREGLSILSNIKATWGIAVCLLGLTGLAGALGQSERAARLFGAEQVLRAKLGTSTERIDLESYQIGLEAARTALSQARFDGLAAEGRIMTLDEIVTYALADAPAPPDHRQATNSRTPTMPLTSRERDVAALIARGHSNRAIAAALVITPRTADTHVMNILTKLKLHSRAQVAAWAVEHGLLTVTEAL